ncbi:MAG: hypothetical protein RLZZ597_3016 [Cyanobacteriota bacterium]|jgi:hypothetical protein
MLNADNGALNPFKSHYLGREALASVMLSIRAQAGCRNWRQFEEAALSEARLILGESNLELLAPTPRFGYVPSAGLFFALEQWSMTRATPFLFENGQPVTALALLEILYQWRDKSGNPVPSPNRIEGQRLERTTDH